MVEEKGQDEIAILEDFFVAAFVDEIIRACLSC
jgi:hypothetical protein